jgi:hypothetical protein
LLNTPCARTNKAQSPAVGSLGRSAVQFVSDFCCGNRDRIYQFRPQLHAELHQNRKRSFHVSDVVEPESPGGIRLLRSHDAEKRMKSRRKPADHAHLRARMARRRDIRLLEMAVDRFIDRENPEI